MAKRRKLRIWSWYKEVTGRRALILGGGGVTGIAWETGLIAGLADLGIDLAAAASSETWTPV